VSGRIVEVRRSVRKVFIRWHLLHLGLEPNTKFQCRSRIERRSWGSVVQVAVAEDKLDVRNEFFHRSIMTRFPGFAQTHLNGTQIHRMFNNVDVIWDVESHRVDRNKERAGRMMFLQLFGDTDGEAMLIFCEPGTRGSKNDAISL